MATRRRVSPEAAAEGGHERPVARDPAADSLFFPAACVYAILALPLWLAARHGSPAGLSPLAGSAWHAHEMIFGFALAVVAGFLLTRIPRPRLALLFTTWLVARIVAFLAPQSEWLVALPNLAFVGLLAWLAAVPFLRAAKKFQNQVIGPVIIGFPVCAAAYQIGAAGWLAGADQLATLLAVDLLALLMLIMGGRAIPPAVAALYQQRGLKLEARVQPRLERLAIVLMLASILCDVWPAIHPAAGLLALAAAAVSARRAAGWRLWTVLERPDLWTLGVGYLWLIVGLALKGLVQLLAPALLIHALHAITIGALGSLTIAMMARARRQRLRKPQLDFTPVARAVLLVGAAALLRLAAPFVPTLYQELLWAATAAWSAAFALLLWHLVTSGNAAAARAGSP